MNQSKAIISKIESFSTVDGPGIRTTIFFSKCNLRCKFCHNPEMWSSIGKEYSIDELYNIIIRNKPYYKNNGGITLSGGEPLLQSKFIIQLIKKLKKDNIHIAIDTAGIGNYNEEIIKNIDLILLDIKHITRDGYLNITQVDKFDDFNTFIKTLNKYKKKIWIRQVIIPDINDNEEYIKDLAKYLHKIKNIEKVEFLPFHTLGFKKYIDNNITNPYQNKKAMDINKCNKLYDLFNKIYKKEH